MTVSDVATAVTGAAVGSPAGPSADPAVDFASAAALCLRDLQQRIGLEGWWVLRRNDHEHIVLAAIDEVFGQSAGTVVSWEDSFCRLTVEQDAPAVAADIDEVACYAAARARNGIPARSLIVVALRAPDGHLIGILRALGTQVRPDLAEHLPTVQVAAAMLGVLLCHELELSEQVRRAERAEGAAHTDALTGVGNRRAWDAALAAEELRCVRHAEQAAVIVVDLNGLKQVNDSRGHHAGDQLIASTAAIIAERVRASDVLARVGGDEFAVLLPRTDLPGAWTVASQLLHALRSAGNSVSIGVAGRSSKTGLVGAWQQADAAMYADKATTRQRPGGSPSAPSPPAAASARRTASPRRAAKASAASPRPSRGPSASPPGAVATEVAALPGPSDPPGNLLSTWDGDEVINGLLDLVRRQLGAEVAFISTLDGDHRLVRNVVSSPLVTSPPVRADSGVCTDSPCYYVATGQVPAITPDVADSAVLAHLPAVAALGIAAFAGVPLHRASGEVYGSLCVYSRRPDPALHPRDAAVLTAVTEPLMRLIEADEQRQDTRHQVLERLERLRATNGLQMHFQPVIDLHTEHLVGAEALARFPGSDQRPDQWFTMAAEVGAGTALELDAVRASLLALQEPTFTGFLALNVSPQTACAPALARILAGAPLSRIVLEITEHESVADYSQIREALAPWRAQGLRLAVDDTGAGYASMSHVLALVPDLIKLDISLVRNVHTDPARRALAAALTTFAAATGAQVIAEGIETAEELACLQAVGVHYGQGYHLARPAPLHQGTQPPAP